MPQRRALVVAVAAGSLLPLAGASAASASVLFNTSYDTRGLDAWSGLHQPAAGGRLSLVDGFSGVTSKVLKAEVRPGDKTYTGSYVAERAEVMGRTPAGGLNSATAANYPDPIGSTRWYHWSVNLKPGFEIPTDSRWVEITQWKGLNGSVPPIGILAEKGHLVMKVKRSTALADADLGAITGGKWVTFTVGIKWSTGNDGWIQVVRDGKTVVPRTATPTMELLNGKVDPTYLKQGVYRGSGWKSTHIAYFTDMKVGTDRADVDDAPIVTPSGGSTTNKGEDFTNDAPSTNDDVISTTITKLPSGSSTVAGQQTPTQILPTPAPTPVPLLTSQVAQRASVTVKRRSSGRLRLDVNGLVRLNAGATGACPSKASVKLQWKRKVAHKTVKVKGVKNCRVKPFIMAPKLWAGLEVTITVTGKGYRRHTGKFKL